VWNPRSSGMASQVTFPLFLLVALTTNAIGIPLMAGLHVLRVARHGLLSHEPILFGLNRLLPSRELAQLSRVPRQTLPIGLTRDSSPRSWANQYSQTIPSASNGAASFVDSVMGSL
jgi:hypothetical protein